MKEKLSPKSFINSPICSHCLQLPIASNEAYQFLTSLKNQIQAKLFWSIGSSRHKHEVESHEVASRTSTDIDAQAVEVKTYLLDRKKLWLDGLDFF